MRQFYEVLISAENQAQADRILNSLLQKKLATGGQFIAAPARFLWKNRVEEMKYVTITSLTTLAKKDELIRDVESTSMEELPMIRFIPIETNDKLADWIEETLA
jgi:uncharacterized protein involved in tolerance to divalent cations